MGTVVNFEHAGGSVDMIKPGTRGIGETDVIKTASYPSSSPWL